MKKLFLTVINIVLILSSQACAHPSFYRGAEIKGQVVDAETKEPIEGVVVVAQWKLYCANPVDGWHCRVLHVHESVTDSNGNYVIPAWGPKARPLSTYLDTSDPMLSYFKRGYTYLTLGNSDIRYFREGLGQEKLDAMSFEEFDKMIEHITPEHKRSLRESVWDGRKIELKKFGGEPIEERVTDVYSAGGKVARQLKTIIDDNVRLDRMLSSLYNQLLDSEKEGIPLKKIKRMVIEYSEAKKQLKAQPPTISPKLEHNIEMFLKEESK